MKKHHKRNSLNPDGPPKATRIAARKLGISFRKKRGNENGHFPRAIWMMAFSIAVCVCDYR